MQRNSWFVIAALLTSIAAWAQSLPPSARVVGTIEGIKAETLEMEIKPDSGSTFLAKFGPETVFQRVSPGEKDLKTAKAIQASDLATGDRVLAVFLPNSAEMRRLVVMPASDIVKRNDADRQDWMKRGVSGVVAAKNGNELTLKTRSFAGETQSIVAVNEKTTYRRYAPDSVKFADAKASSIAEINVGDQVRARGDKSADGAKVSAEDVVFGTFLTKAGSIVAVNAETKEIQIKEIGTGKPLTVKLTADSQMKAMPSFPGMGGGMPGATPGSGMPGGMQRPASGGPPTGGPPPGMMGGGRAPDFSQMLERMPAAKLEDLKPGQSIVVSSTKGAKPDEVTAITILANADMLIQMASAQSAGANRPRNGAGAGAGPGGMGAGPSMGGLGGMGGGLELPGMIP